MPNLRPLLTQSWQNFKTRLRIYLVVGLVLFVVFVVFVFIMTRRSEQNKVPKITDVSLPTIVNGELILPLNAKNGGNNLAKTISDGKLAVNSANLVAIFDQNKLSGIRIVGEVTNIGDRYASDMSPIVRFFDVDGRSVGQKIAHNSVNYVFHDLGANEKSLYDVTVDSPPQSDKVEIFFNVASSTDSAIFEPLKIASRSLETKNTTMGASDSAQAVDYYIATGKIVNPFETAISDIAVYAWVKNETDKVFAVGHTEYKNDLVAPGQSVDFSIMVLPLQGNQTMSSYEISAWGREYRLNY
jgi:hypothetical protein